MPHEKINELIGFRIRQQITGTKLYFVEFQNGSEKLDHVFLKIKIIKKY